MKGVWMSKFVVIHPECSRRAKNVLCWFVDNNKLSFSIFTLLAQKKEL